MILQYVGMLAPVLLFPAFASPLHAASQRHDYTLYALTATYFGVMVIVCLTALPVWAVVGLNYRVAFGVAAIGLIATSAPQRPFAPNAFERPEVIELTVFTALSVFALVALVYGQRAGGREALALHLPFRFGTYLCLQGGGIGFINRHRRVKAQRFAIDLVGLQNGRRARGIAPSDLEAYAIYGRPVTSPCEGTVIAVTSEVTDGPPGAGNARCGPAGNHVVIACRDYRIVLAHLKYRSLTVDVGDRLVPGDPIGLVGNSGNSSEPHLHIHAERDGLGVPMLFDGRIVYRNVIVNGSEPLRAALARGRTNSRPGARPGS